mmetsp:Transcript_15964/g.14331  ORF Transcript_15964/g.14331 Transcript_15964/m.14331 type:complete len:894 (+) Transcript_15964:23-2704(+)|eukprot:CAMPEP_0201576892 /NCGR_PEP_ID=MMETSP0190_2-20130828/22962_1 /ASSEMBLY_ACC=CAM_ASM_000263 /TAXON_ID=37353 /ORGANISM="Rosalina sp." /LENGTH=893 /DNA_ID=CAMNT_0048008287 /DNA_START=37 /DNA_END=2718 /DNA_ORIENTATION=-
MGACLQSTATRVSSLPQQDDTEVEDVQNEVMKPAKPRLRHRLSVSVFKRKSTDMISAATPESSAVVRQNMLNNNRKSSNISFKCKHQQVELVDDMKTGTKVQDTVITINHDRNSTQITNQAQEGGDNINRLNLNVDGISEGENMPTTNMALSTKDSIDSMIRKLSLPGNCNTDKMLKIRFQRKRTCSNSRSNDKENINCNCINSTKDEDFHIRFGNRYKSESDDDENNQSSDLDIEIKEKEDEASSETTTNSKSPKPTQIESNNKTKRKSLRYKPPKNYELSSTEIKEDDDNSSSMSLSYFESITKLTAMTCIGGANSSENDTMIEKAPQSERTISKLSTAGYITPITPIHNMTPTINNKGRTSLLIAQSSPSDFTTTSRLSARLSLKFNQISSHKPKSLVSIPSNKQQYKYQYQYQRTYGTGTTGYGVTNPFYHDSDDEEHDDMKIMESMEDDRDHTVAIIKGLTSDNADDIDSDHTLDNIITVDDDDSMQSTDDESYGSYNWYQSFNRASTQKAIGHDITKMVQKMKTHRKSILGQHIANNASLDSLDSGASKIVNFDSEEVLNVNTTNSSIRDSTMSDIKISKIPKIHHQLSKDKIRIHKPGHFSRNIHSRGAGITPKDTPRDSITRSLSLIPTLGIEIPSKTPTHTHLHPQSKTFTPTKSIGNRLLYYSNAGASSNSYNSSMRAQMSSMSSLDTDVEIEEEDDDSKLVKFKVRTPTNNLMTQTNDSIKVLINNSNKSLMTNGHNNNNHNPFHDDVGVPPVYHYPPPLNTPIFGSSDDTLIDDSTDNEMTPSTVEFNAIHNAPPLPMKWIQNGSNHSYYQYTHYNYYYYDDNDKQKVQQIPLHHKCPPPHAFNAFSNHKSDFEENNNHDLGPTSPSNHSDSASTRDSTRV